MKAIAYHLLSQQKELLIIANHKKHDITIIGNQLTLETLAFAAGKEALLILNEMSLTDQLVDALQHLGIKYIVTTSLTTVDVDLILTDSAKIEIISFPLASGGELEQYKSLIRKLDYWAADRP